MAYAEKTDIPLERSIAEIVGMLKKAGAERIAQVEEPERFTVQCFINDRFVRFRVRFPTLEEMSPTRGSRPSNERDRELARQRRIRQRGRALRLVIEAKLESVASEVESFEEAFLANVVGANGQTVYERIQEPLALEYQSGKVTPLLALTGPRA